MRRNDEAYTSAAMRVLVQPLLDEDLARFDAYNKIPCEYSPQFRQRIAQLFRRDKLQSFGRASLILLKRAAICAMVGILVLLVSCAAIKPLRDKVIHIIIEHYSEYATVDFESEETDPIARRLTYIPESYTLIDEASMDNYCFIRYSDEAGDLITFSCQPSSDDLTYHDTEFHDMEKIEINGTVGLYFAGENGSDTLTWSQDGYTYSINSSKGREELIKMAESLS